MSHYKVRVSEVLLESYQNAAARLSGPLQAVPRPGQFLQAYDPADALAVLPASIFLAGEGAGLPSNGEVDFAVAGPLPASWQPGVQLRVRGPLGRGFAMPKATRRLVLAATANPGRLLPLLAAAPEVALFCDAPAGDLPAAVEVQPLAALPAALGWADFLALDIEPERLDDLPALLGLKERLPKTLRSQALVAPPMPCGGLAQCGVCTLAAARGPRLACEHGPVFDLAELL